MISFYKDDTCAVMYKNGTCKETKLFVIDRPATQTDIDAHSDEYAAFLAAAAPTDLPTAEASPEATEVSK